jgi:molecular chaperone GrpE
MREKAEHHGDDAVNDNTAAAGKGDQSTRNAKAERKSATSGDTDKEGFSDPLEFLNAELERVEAEKAEYQDRAMRLAAEMENLRKRTQKDVADARAFSIAGFAREMLAVSDNLQRALQAIPQEARNAGDEGFKALIEGVELTERSMMQALEKNGVRRISPLNERFDPNFHQAMFEIPDNEVANNTVLQVVQDGYVIGDRCLRPALVGVSKGGPKQKSADPVGNGQNGTAANEED